jgi:predicted Zn-dependent protease
MGILFPNRNSSGRSSMSSCSLRMAIALAIAGFSLFSYWKMRSPNPVTGQIQHVNLSTDEEIALGLNAAPEMAAQFGGLSQDQDARLRVDEIGQHIVAGSEAHKAPYRYAFHALADATTVNAFALPGGQIFITQALLSRLSTDGQIAGVLGHETGHVISRHSAEHLAKSQLMQGLTIGAVIASTDPNNPRTYNNGMLVALVGQMINLKYSRDDELEADRWGVKLMGEAGYDPRSMIDVMKILEQASGTQGRGPDFMSSHPNPGRRIEHIEQAIKEFYPNGVPDGLKK